MKSLFLRIAIIALAVSGTVFVPANLTAAPTNLVANPSVETANSTGTAPLSWLTDRWGTNTAKFSYPSTGHTGSRSVRTEVSSYSSGDAKWYFTPVAVTPGTDYTYSDFYMSNVTTGLVAMITSTTGQVTYTDLIDNTGSVTSASSTAWKAYTGRIHTSANAKTLTILHIISKNGWLQLDDVSLTLSSSATPTPTPTATVTSTPTSTVTPTPTATPTPTPTPSNSLGFFNPGLEIAASATMPKNWQHSSWGTNSPVYTYMNEGHSGSRSVKVALTSYTDGDAKWVNDPQALPTGKYYRFGVWYKTNTIPHAVVEYEKTDGSYDYFGMPDPEPAAGATSTWQYYSDTFYVPAGTKTVNAFLFVSNVGWVQTDDYTLAPYTYAGLTRPLVTMTFDDAFEENVTTALPLLNSYGFKTTQCYATQYVEGIASAEQIVLKYRDSGHETCSHSVTHPWLSQIPTSQVDYELQHSRDYLQQLTGQAVTDFASPFGDYNASVNTEIAKYYKSHRTTDEGLNSKDNFNPYRIRVQNMTPTTTLAQYQSWLDQAKATNTWLVLVYHRIGPNDGTLEDYDTATGQFKQQLAALKSSGLPVVRYDAALAEVSAQR